MTREFKPAEAAQLGANIRQRRVEERLTLSGMAEKIQIDAGQISRIERGKFILFSKNLQIICKFLQITPYVSSSRYLGERFIRFAEASTAHRNIAESIIDALEILSQPENNR